MDCLFLCQGWRNFTIYCKTILSLTTINHHVWWLILELRSALNGDWTRVSLSSVNCHGYELQQPYKNNSVFSHLTNDSQAAKPHLDPPDLPPYPSNPHDYDFITNKTLWLNIQCKWPLFFLKQCFTTFFLIFSGCFWCSK